MKAGAGLRMTALLVVAIIIPTACGSPAPRSEPTAAPAPPPGSRMVAVPAAGIQLPVPDGWEIVGTNTLSDPATRVRLQGTYPGTDRLLGTIDQLNGSAVPVFLALDPSAASVAAPLASSLSVMLSQPSVSGPLLEVAAGFVEGRLNKALGAQGPQTRDRIDLAAGEAIRLRYAIRAANGQQVLTEAWVIGASSGTLLVTLVGTESALGDLDSGAIAAAIRPSPTNGP